MAKDASIEGLRSSILTSVFGRRLGFDSSKYLVGPRELLVQVTGFSSVGSTVVSTGTGAPAAGTTCQLSNYGVSVIGTTAASGTTLNAYFLEQPQPSVEKIIFNPTTGSAYVWTSTDNSTGGPSVGAAYIASTKNSTSQYIIFNGLGSYICLKGLSTALWGVIGMPAGFTTGVTTAVTFGS